MVVQGITKQESERDEGRQDGHKLEIKEEE